MTADNFEAGLAQANLGTKNDTAEIAKGMDYDNKVKYINKKVISNKKKTCGGRKETH